MNGYKHTVGVWGSLIQQLFCPYKRKDRGNATKSLRIVGFFPLKAHKYTVQPLETLLKLSFDMIEFSYAQ